MIPASTSTAEVAQGTLCGAVVSHCSRLCVTAVSTPPWQQVHSPMSLQRLLPDEETGPDGTLQLFAAPGLRRCWPRPLQELGQDPEV